VRGSPLFSPCRERDVHRLVPDGTMVLVGLSVDHLIRSLQELMG
jgi:hypothetical protein